MNFIGNMYWFLIRSYKKGALKRTPPHVPLAMILGLNYAWIFNSNDIEKEIVFQNMKLQIKQCSADHRYDKLHIKKWKKWIIWRYSWQKNSQKWSQNSHLTFLKWAVTTGQWSSHFSLLDSAVDRLRRRQERQSLHHRNSWHFRVALLLFLPAYLACCHLN